MQKKIFAWAMSMAVAAMITCTGCTQNSSTSSGTDSETAQTTTLEETDGSVSSQNLSAVQSGTAGVTTDAGDLCDTYDSFDAEIALADDDTKVTGNTKAVSVKNNRVTISAGGTYRISGKLTKGQVVVTGSEKVKLYLDGAEITSPSGPALVCVNEKRTVLSLAKGTKNVLTDSADNAEAFEAVYERYKRLVYHVACQIVHDPHLAEDVAQEVFLYIAKNFAHLHRQDPHKFAAYLVSCTRSRAFLLLAQRPDAPGEEEPDFDRNTDPAPVPEDAVIDEQQAQHLMQAVQQLAPIYRDPLRLLAQGYTYREIAAALALRESTVRQRIARGRKLLWKELHDER